MHIWVHPTHAPEASYTFAHWEGNSRSLNIHWAIQSLLYLIYDNDFGFFFLETQFLLLPVLVRWENKKILSLALKWQSCISDAWLFIKHKFTHIATKLCDFVCCSSEAYEVWNYVLRKVAWTFCKSLLEVRLGSYMFWHLRRRMNATVTNESLSIPVWLHHEPHAHNPTICV